MLENAAESPASGARFVGRFCCARLETDKKDFITNLQVLQLHDKPTYFLYQKALCVKKGL